MGWAPATSHHPSHHPGCCSRGCGARIWTDSTWTHRHSQQRGFPGVFTLLAPEPGGSKGGRVGLLTNAHACPSRGRGAPSMQPGRGWGSSRAPGPLETGLGCRLPLSVPAAWVQTKRPQTPPLEACPRAVPFPLQRLSPGAQAQVCMDACVRAAVAKPHTGRFNRHSFSHLWWLEVQDQSVH